MEVCRGHGEEELLIIDAGEGAEDKPSIHLMYSPSSFILTIGFLSKYLNYCEVRANSSSIKPNFILRQNMSVKEIEDFILFLKKNKQLSMSIRLFNYC